MIAFTDGRVFVGDGQVLERTTVIIADEKINRVQAGGDALPSGCREIPIGKDTLFPGFIDCHVHLMMDGSPDPLTTLERESDAITLIKGVTHARKTLEAGVTTVRDLGAPRGLDIALRQGVDKGLIPGPRMLVAGHPVCMTGGHGWPMGREADGADEVRKAAREQLKAGADVIKLMATGGVLTQSVQPGSPQLNRDELTAGVAEAHKAGKRTAAHAMGSQGILDAIHAGIDSIEHGIYLTDEIIALMTEKGVFFIPTIAALDNIEKNGVSAGIPAWAVDKSLAVAPHHRNSITAAYRAGVSIAMGTDAGTPFNFHGRNLAEIPLLVGNGLSSAEALTAATGTAARVLGLEDTIGGIRPGMAADLVLVKGNPLEDVDAVARDGGVVRVMKGGQLIKETD